MDSNSGLVRTIISFVSGHGGLYNFGDDWFVCDKSLIILLDFCIATSSRDDLHRRVGGRCSSHNMKVVFKVCCQPGDNNSPTSKRFGIESVCCTWGVECMWTNMQCVLFAGTTEGPPGVSTWATSTTKNILSGGKSVGASLRPRILYTSPVWGSSMMPPSVDTTRPPPSPRPPFVSFKPFIPHSNYSGPPRRSYEPPLLTPPLNHQPSRPNTNSNHHNHNNSNKSNKKSMFFYPKYSIFSSGSIMYVYVY